MTVVEGLRTNSGVVRRISGSSQLPIDTRQRLEEMAASSRTRTSRSASVSGSAPPIKSGSTPNLAVLSSGSVALIPLPPKRGQEETWRVPVKDGSQPQLANNNNGIKMGTGGSGNGNGAQVVRRDSREIRDLNLKNSGGGVGGSVDTNPLMQLSEQQQQQLPASLTQAGNGGSFSDPSKKVRPRSFWANWWRF